MIFNNVYWTKVLIKVIYVIGSIVGVYLAFKMAIFYMPFLIAFVISLIIEPAIRFIMKKLNFTRRTSSIIIFVIVLGIIAGGLVWGIVTLISEATNLLQMLNEYFDKASYQIQMLTEKLEFDKIKIPEQILNLFQNSTGEILETISTWLKNTLTKLVDVITSIPSIAIYFVITILSLYFICTDKIYILDQAEHHLPKKWMRKISIHLKEITQTLGGYLKAQAILIFVSFIISIIGLYIYKIAGLNVPYPLLIALSIAFVDALPILGSGTVMIPWAVGSSLNGDIRLGIAIIVLWIIMSVVKQFIEPRIVSKQIGIHPFFTLVAMYTGFKFMGIIGLVLGPIILIILSNIFSTLISRGIFKSIFEG